jgi:cation:H+ antiporter
MTCGSNSRQRARAAALPAFALLVLVAVPFEGSSPGTALWAAPAILLAAMLIAWAAESAQFFIAQGFALAILAWLQTLPEFAVEFVLAWKQRVDLLLANLTGALRLLTGLGWPMIYFVAAYFHRRAHHRPLRRIRLDDAHSIEVVGLFLPLAYITFVWAKRSLTLIDAAVLILIYAGYLVLLRRMPAEEMEDVEEMESVPRTILKSPPLRRTLLIVGFFVAGGLLIYVSAEPFLGSLLAISMLLGIPSFVFVQWVAPLVSEFPEKVSAFYWARTVDRAPMALMNMVSSNINQWTLLAAMLPIVYSISRGRVSGIPLDSQQELELLMTIAQSFIGLTFLLNMELAWWEAAALFSLWAVQFGFSPIPPGPGAIGFIATHIHRWVTVAYLAWAAAAVLRMVLGRQHPAAFRAFALMWDLHLRPGRGGPTDRD